MRQRRPLYHCVAGVKPLNLPQSDPGSEQWLWRNLSSSSGIARTLLSPITSWIIAFWEWILYRWIAGIEHRNLQVSDSGSNLWLWWSVAAVAPECGCWVFWWKECRVRFSLRLSAEKPPVTRESYAYHSLSDWSELAFSLIQRWCSENRTLSASLPVTRPRGL